MPDRDPFELVELSPAVQPPTGLGDRILVGLALIALVGGALIAVANVLPDADEVAQASPSEPVTSLRPIPTPVPARVVTVVQPDFEFGEVAQPYIFDGWIRASVDLAIRANAQLDSTQIGVLKADEVAYASQQDQPADEPGWLFLQDQVGWVATIAGGEPLAYRYQYPQFRGSGWIQSVSAGPNGFVATVAPPSNPYTYEYPRPAISSDGVSWRLSDSSPFGLWYPPSPAWGPAGWLVAASASDPNQSQVRIWIWSSPDGLRWTRLGMMGGVRNDYVVQLIGSDHGYLMETQGNQGGFSNGSTLWSSIDGQTWRESIDPIVKGPSYGQRQLWAALGGIYLSDSSGGEAASPSLGAFSADGLIWSKVAGPNGVNLRLADFQGQIVAFDIDRTTQATRAWSGVIVNGQLVWQHHSEIDPAFANAVATQVVSDGKRVFAFGWDRSTEDALVWTGTGTQWLRKPLPGSFGALPVLAAAGAGRVVVVGHRQTLRGENPIVWHRTAGGGWLPEPDPVLDLVPDPSTDDCPALPTDYLDFMVLDSAAVISCYGPGPITFQAYSVACFQCGGAQEGNLEPAWLINSSLNALFLAPDEGNSGWQNTAVLAPDLTLDPAWTDAWVEVTGHFDDPAAATCHIEPTIDMLPWWSGQQSVIDQCRQTFVVTAVKVVSAP
jgi:hypothetical protein